MKVTLQLICSAETPIGGFDLTCFMMTVLHRCASHKVRQLVFQDFGSVFFKNHWLDTHNLSVWNLKDGERDKFDRHYLRTFFAIV